MWSLRCTAVYEARHIDIPDPSLLELFEMHCLLSINPRFEEEVSEKLFFADHTAPDPFPGDQAAIPLTPLVRGQQWAVPSPTHEVTKPSTGPEPASEPATATSWLVTLHLLAAPGEADEPGAEYSRLLTAVRYDIPGLTLRSASPFPQPVDHADPDITAAIAGPLWVAEAQKVAADPTTAGVYPLARNLYRARLVVGCPTDPATLLPGPNLPGSWETEPLA